MASTWKHPQFGAFKFNGTVWEGTVRAPGFDRFSYDTGYSNAGPPNGEYPLTFATESASETPSPVMVDLAQRVLADPAAMVATVTHALWEDFNGRGPGSRMWWHGDLEQIIEDVEEEGLKPPAGPDDLLIILRLYGIAVSAHHYGVDEPLAELGFWALFEPEHDVGVLTDGRVVRGIGYSYSVRPFRSDVE